MKLRRHIKTVKDESLDLSTYLRHGSEGYTVDDLGHTLKDLKAGKCGAVACLGGFAGTIFNREGLWLRRAASGWVYPQFNRMRNANNSLAATFALSHRESYWLFDGRSQQESEGTDREVGLRRIDTFLKDSKHKNYRPTLRRIIEARAGK